MTKYDRLIATLGKVHPVFCTIEEGFMTNQDIVTAYNYDVFTPEKVLPWLSFESSPELGQPAPDFPLWDLDGRLTSLSEIWSARTYTVVEFGSFT